MSSDPYLLRNTGGQTAENVTASTYTGPHGAFRVQLTGRDTILILTAEQGSDLCHWLAENLLPYHHAGAGIDEPSYIRGWNACWDNVLAVGRAVRRPL